jgi:phosphoglycolate phosphatase
MIETLPPCILFDLDGTIVDSLPGIEFSLHEAFSACMLPVVKRNLRELIGPPIRIILSNVGQVFDESQLDALEKAFRLSYDSHGWRKTVGYPNVGNVLRTLQKRGHRLFVVTNKPRPASLRVLEREQLLDCFEAIVTRDSRNPDYQTKEEMIGALLTDRLSPRDCVMVGDTVEDAIAAAKGGVPFILMKHGYGRLSEISSVLVAHTMENFSQFYEFRTKELMP